MTSSTSNRHSWCTASAAVENPPARLRRVGPLLTRGFIPPPRRQPHSIVILTPGNPRGRSQHQFAPQNPNPVCSPSIPPRPFLGLPFATGKTFRPSVASTSAENRLLPSGSQWPSRTSSPRCPASANRSDSPPRQRNRRCDCCPAGSHAAASRRDRVLGGGAWCVCDCPRQQDREDSCAKRECCQPVYRDSVPAGAQKGILLLLLALHPIARLSLMPDRKNQHGVVRLLETEECHIPGATTGNHQFPQRGKKGPGSLKSWTTPSHAGTVTPSARGRHPVSCSILA